MKSTGAATFREPYIGVTKDTVIEIHARPPITADEIAYYSHGEPVMKSRGWKLAVAWLVTVSAGICVLAKALLWLGDLVTKLQVAGW